MSRPFTDHPMLRGQWEPWPMEGEIHDLPVTGEIPRDLNGSFYRNGPNPQFPPRGDYHFFTGDGMVHAFQIEDGRCHYRNRWVRTPRFELEREAGEALFAGFDFSQADPRSQGVPNGPANTNIVWHAGKLLALVEGGLPPVELDPDTLETRRVWDWDGALRRPIDPALARAMGIESPDGRSDGIFTAHPKLDPETGEMLGFGYNAVQPYLIYYVISAEGELVRSETIDIPFPSMVHDFVVTRDHVVFPIFPATLRPERVARGESVLGWEPELGTHVGVMPRNGGAGDLRWFETEASYVFHPLNGHDDGRRVVMEMAEYPHLPISAAGSEIETRYIPAHLTRWTLDLDGGSLKREDLDDRGIEFPRLDERRSGLPYRFGYAGCEGDAIPGFHQILRYDLQTGGAMVHELGEGSAASEPVFVPRDDSAAEGEGYLLAVVYRGQTGRSELRVLDAENLEGEPLATVHLPHRVPGGFHGNWRPGR